MDRRKNLKEILKKIEKLDSHYFSRSLFIDRNELEVLCNNIIENEVENIIEIGTYKGVASAIFASIISGKLHTINVDDKEIELSKKMWSDLGIKNIIQHKGSSLDVLPKVVKELKNVGFVYVDGHHGIPYARKEFDIIKKSDISKDDCLVYFDDGPLDGVMDAIKHHNLITLENYEWMKKDEIAKNGTKTMRAYHKFNNFKINFGKKI
jgi:predicted O-methyltransferase YrrM